MTTPADQTPPPHRAATPPLNPHWPAHMQPAPYTPPAGPPVKPPNSLLAFWRSSTGVAIALLILGALVVLGLRLTGTPAADRYEVNVTGCTANSDGSVATIAFTVHNTGPAVADVAVDIEYRDGAGSRLDTDTARVRDLAAGDTARAEESTVLDGSAEGLTCRITGVR